MFIFLRVLVKETLVAPDDCYRSWTKQKLFCRILWISFPWSEGRGQYLEVSYVYGELRTEIFSYCQCWRLYRPTSWQGWGLVLGDNCYWACPSFHFCDLIITFSSNRHLKDLPWGNKLCFIYWFPGLELPVYRAYKLKEINYGMVFSVMM